MNAWKLGSVALVIVCVFIVSLALAAPDVDPSNPQGQTIDTTTIRWTWNDNSSNEDGFQVRDTLDNPIANVGAGVTLYDETGLSENTQYTRRVVGYTESAGADQDALTYGSPSFSSGNYNMGFIFTPTTDITMTKVKTNRGTCPVTIWRQIDATTGELLRTVNVTGTAGTWAEADVTPPLDLTSGQTYRIAVYHASATWYYQSAATVGSTADITLVNGCYYSGAANYPSTNYSNVAGECNFVYHTMARDFGGPTADVPKYTAVHDPTEADFELADIGGAQVQITVTPPPNQLDGVTGVYIERDETGDWTGADYAVITGTWTQTYTQTDTVPYNADWQYRITFRNGDDVQTASSPVKSIVIKSYPPTAPTGFSGTLVSPTSIRWDWTDNASDETGFVIQDGSDSAVMYVDADTESATETGLTENTEYTRQCRAYRWPFYAETQACSYDGAYSSSTYSYHRGFMFIPKADIEITKVSRYTGSMVRVHDYGGTQLYEHTFSSTPDATWAEEDLSTPWTLTGGVPYRISVYNGGSSYTYYYDAIGSVTEAADIDIFYGCYGTTYPSSTSSSYVYGLVNFKYRVLLHSAAGYDGVYYSTSSGAYPRGFRFTTSEDIWVAKLSRLRGTRVTIHDDATEAILLEHVFSSVPENEWSEEDVAIPLKLEAGKTYRISTWNDGTSFTYTYEYLSHTRAGSGLTINSGCYGNSTSGQWPITTNASYVYGVVNFKYATQPNYSTATSTDTIYTPVHEPGDADLTLVDAGSAQVAITVAKPVNDGVGQTGVYIERSDDEFDWSSPFMVDNGWFEESGGDGDPYTRVDTVPNNGVWWYRMKFRNQVTDETGWFKKSIDIVSYPPIPPTAFQADTASTTDTSITWQWTDNSTDEAGFEIQDDTDTRIVDAAAGATSVVETGLTENTAYTRHCHAYNILTGMGNSFPDIYPTAATPGSNPDVTFASNLEPISNMQTEGDALYWSCDRQNFPLNDPQEIWAEFDFDISSTGLDGIDIVDLTFTSKVYFTGSSSTLPLNDPMEIGYIDEARVQIYNYNSTSWEDIGGNFFTTLRPSIFRDSAESQLWDNTLDSNPDNPIVRLKDSGWSDDYVSSNTIKIRVYIAGGLDGTGHEAVWIFDHVKIDITGEQRNYSTPTSSITEYTRVHEPVAADLQLEDAGSAQVDVTVTEPVNHDVGQTGVYIERAADSGFTTTTAIVGGGWTQTYTQTDTVPNNGTWWYRIKFRNQVSVETGWYVDSVLVESFPPAAPTGFQADTASTTDTSITWEWTDNSNDEAGFEIQDDSDTGMIDAAVDATSVVESGLTENTAYTRHCHAYNIPGGGGTYPDIYPTAVTPGSNPSVAFASNGEAISNLQVVDDSLYWSCDIQNTPLNDPQEYWAEFDFDISSTGITKGSYISSMTFISKVYFTGGGTAAPAIDPLEIAYVDQAKVQIYNYNSTSWEDMGGNFFTTLRPTLFRDSAESQLWDYTTDVNPDNPIVRTKDTGWSNDYVSGNVVKIRVYIEGGIDQANNWEIFWIFDHVKIDIVSEPRNYSDPSNTVTEYTRVHEPVDADLELTDLFSSGQMEVKITSPVNATTGLTGVYIERAADSGFTTSTAIVGGDWTQVYTQIDTLPSNGTWWYRIKYRNQVDVETGWWTESMDMISYPPDAPDEFQADSGTITSTSITWTWNDNSTGESGFELQDGSDTWIADAAANATSYTESGLAENTQYTRHARAYTMIPGSEQDALTYNGTPSATSTTYTMGFEFTANADLTVTKVKVYTNGVKVTIWDMSRNVLATIDPVTGGAAWPSYDLTTPIILTSGQNYMIAVRTTGYHNISMSDVTASSDITVVRSWHDTADDFPDTGSSTTIMYGVVNFVCATDTKTYSSASEEVSIYTAIHDPTGADFTVTAGAFGQADIVVTPPNNPAEGQTAVQIRRSASADMSGAVIVKDFDVAGYSYTDTVPSGGTWYYAITFRNAEERLTAESASKSVVISGPLEIPGNFSGEGIALDTIQWTWDDVAGVDGYLFQDGSGSTRKFISAPASSYQETVAGENTPETRQLRSCIIGTTRLAVEPPLVMGCTIPWYSGGARVQQLYTQAELSSTEGAVKKIYWRRNLLGAEVTYNNVTIKLGHTSLSALGTSFANNFTEGDATQVWFTATYTVSATALDSQWYEIALTGNFYYDGTHNLIVDINVESGSDTIGWSRGDGVDTMLYGNPGGTVGSLQQRKLYIRLDVDEVTNKSTPAGPVTAHSEIRDATISHFSLADTGTLGVDIMIEQPLNAFSGITGVKVERADDQAFTVGVTEVQAFAPIYSLTDVVPAEGKYWYRITYRNGDGKEAATSSSMDVDVTGSVIVPIAEFSGTPTSGLTPLTVSFTDESTGTITSWDWDFGDGIGTSTEKHPTYEYTSAGTYTVGLTVSGPGGSDSEFKAGYITVTDPPAIWADFYAVPEAGEVPLLVQFYNGSTGTVNTWEWDFDDDSVIDSTEENPTYLYGIIGTYTVSLKVTGPAGEHTETKTGYIEVVPPGTPIADFTASPTSGIAPLTVDFTDESSGSITTWEWDFDNDTIIDSTAQNPTYEYTSPGTYTVTLTVTGPGGSDDEIKTDHIQVNPPAAPVADFSATPTTGLVPLTVDFTDESTGGITTWEWDFDNDTVVDSTAQNPTYEYTSAGTYTVTLTVTGPGGSDDEIKTDYIQVNAPVPPVAEFSGSPLSGSAVLTVSFTDESTGDVTEWSWDFGDGIGTSSQQNPTYDYDTPGAYTVSLTVTGPGGSDTEVKTDYITVFDPSTLRADFTATPTNGPAQLTVDFTDTSTGVHDTYIWDFGDGGTSTEQNPTYTYNIAGTYTVTLSIDGPDGNDSETKVDYITVLDPGTITADFDATPKSGIAPLDVQFADLSVGAVDDWSWDFGDGGTSTQRNPNYQYATPGLYDVTLTVSGPSGSNTEIKTNFISVSATPAADSDGGGGCSCKVDSGPTPLNHLLGYFLPLMLLACAYLALRRREAQA